MNSELASSSSFYPGSPDSKSTLYTPVNGLLDECFPRIAPSDINHSPQDDGFGTWKPLMPGLLQSPSLSHHTKFNAGSHLFRDSALEVPSRDPKSYVATRAAAKLPTSPESRSPSERSILFSDFSPPVQPYRGEDGFSYQPNEGVRSVEDEEDIRDEQSLYKFSGDFPYLVQYTPLDPGDDWAVSPTRYLRIGIIPVNASRSTIFKILQDEGRVQDVKFESEGYCIASYYDIRCAIAAYTRMRTETNWAVRYCSSAYFVMLMGGGDSTPVANADVFCALISGRCTRSTSSVLFDAFTGFGEVARFSRVEKWQQLFYRITYSNHDNSSYAIDTLDGQYLEGMRLKVSFSGPEFAPWIGNSRVATSQILTSDLQASPAQHRDLDILCPQPIRPSLDVPLPQVSSESTESSRYVDSLYEGESFGASSTQRNAKPEFRPFASKAVLKYTLSSQARRQLSHSSPKLSTFSQSSADAAAVEKVAGTVSVLGKNVIDLERIASGQDTRTTVMLRNIPNKVDQQTLKEYIDETSKSLYNFLYLRIDFRNICNVGYAFINFLDPLDIMEFVKAKSGTRWNKFNSEKVLDVTYANIQGIDQLVEKFRNSSVMDQDPSYRPKLFHSSGPYIGAERDFPPPNNILKKCRSISAAQQIGLFAPKMSTTGKGVWRKRE